jgi:hypothetical protein
MEKNYVGDTVLSARDLGKVGPRILLTKKMRELTTEMESLRRRFGFDNYRYQTEFDHLAGQIKEFLGKLEKLRDKGNVEFRVRLKDLANNKN